MSNNAQRRDLALHAYKNAQQEAMAKEIARTMYRYDRIAQDRLSTPEELDADAVRKFWSQGYLVVDRVLDPAEVARSTEAIMDIVYGKVTGPKVQLVKRPEELHTPDERELATRKVHNYIQHEPRLHAVAYHEKILAMMAKLLGEPPKVAQDQAILKPPTGGAEKPWHQDMAYGNLAYDKSVVGIWIALDSAELDNGCMHVIPGSHRGGGAPHYAVRDWQLCDSGVQVETDIAVPLAPGGALLFSGLLHHGTPPNFSVKRRRALQIHYAGESAQKLTPEEYKRMFTNVMTNAEC